MTQEGPKGPKKPAEIINLEEFRRRRMGQKGGKKGLSAEGFPEAEAPLEMTVPELLEVARNIVGEYSGEDKESKLVAAFEVFERESVVAGSSPLPELAGLDIKEQTQKYLQMLREALNEGDMDPMLHMLEDYHKSSTDAETLHLFAVAEEILRRLSPNKGPQGV